MTGPRLAPAAMVVAGALALGLTGCKGNPPPRKPEKTTIPKDLQTQSTPQDAQAGAGTPLKDRVATLGLLNKRNNHTQDIRLKPGQSKRIGNVIVRLAACERTPPWENPPETGAFVQVFVHQRKDVHSPYEWDKIFSGWLFKNSPSINVVQHPVYDVWVKDCAMSFPGEKAPASASKAS